MFKQSLKLIFFATLGVILRYGYRIVVSRSLGLEIYGRIGVVMTLLNIFVLFLLSSIPPTMAKFRAEGKLVMKSAYKFLYLGLGSSLLLLVLSPLIMKYMEMPFLYVLIVATCVPIGTVAAVYRGILQGTHRTDEFGISQVVRAVGFLGFVLFSIWMGWNELGAVFALFVGMVLSVIYLYPKVRKEKSEGEYFNKLWRYFIPISATRIVDAFVLNIDLLMLKIWSPLSVAGMYAIAGPIARLPLFAFSSIATVLLPKVSGNKKDGKRLTKKAIMISLLIIVVTFVLVAIPEPIIKVLFDPQLTLDEWKQTVTTLRILAFATAFIGLYKLFAASLQGLGLARELCYFTLGVLVFEMIIGATLIPPYGMVGAASATLLSSLMATVGAFLLLKIRGGEMLKKHHP